MTRFYSGALGWCNKDNKLDTNCEGVWCCEECTTIERNPFGYCDILECPHFEARNSEIRKRRVINRHGFRDDIFCAFATGKTSEERGKKECDE